MKKLAALIVLLLGASISSGHAQLLNFNFSFTSQYYYSYASSFSYTEPETYTLTGEIIGLQNNASSVPSDVLLFGTIFPDHGGLNGFNQNPYSLVAHGFTEIGSFTVSNGAIVGTSSGGVSYNYRYQSTNFDIWDNFYFNAVSAADGTDGAHGITSVNGQNGGSDVVSGSTRNYSGEEAYNTNGFSGATYTLAVPEPSAWGLRSLALAYSPSFAPARTKFSRRWGRPKARLFTRASKKAFTSCLLPRFSKR